MYLYIASFIALWIIFGFIGTYRLYRHALVLEEALIAFKKKEESVNSMHLSAQYMLERSKIVEQYILFFKMLEQKRTTPLAFYVGAVLSSIVLGPILFIRT